MELRTITALLDGVPWITPDEGRRLYEQVRDTRPLEVLNLGTAHGVSAAYIAAALEANGDGHVTTVDHSAAAFTDPTAEELLERVGLAHRVSIVKAHSDYNWFLKERIEDRSDANGNCEPLYDFCFLDGAHNWTIDGLAIFLVAKLLKDDGWLVLDDLRWTYRGLYEGEGRPDCRDAVYAGHVMSDAELDSNQVDAVFRLLVMRHPAFVEFRVQDSAWGFARKGSGENRTLRITSSRSVSDLLALYLQKTVNATRRRIQRR